MKPMSEVWASFHRIQKTSLAIAADWFNEDEEAIHHDLGTVTAALVEIEVLEGSIADTLHELEATRAHAGLLQARVDELEATPHG